MAFTVSFGNSGGGGLMTNWGFMLLVIAIFLYFTGMWRMVGNQWNKFFGSSLWTQTIGNMKGTWQAATPQAPPQGAPPK